MNVIDWVKQHPWETGGIVFIGGLAVLYFLRAMGGGSGQSSGVDPNVAAYLNAEAAQNQAGDALQATQIQATAAVAESQANAAANVDINNTWAATNVVQTQEATKQSLIAQIGGVANKLGTTLTSSWSAAWGGGSSSNGFFGLGGGSNSYSGSKGASSQSFVANSEQGQAVGLLGQIEQSQFHAGN